MQAVLKQLMPEIIEIRQRIHANPELAYEEVVTANLVSDTLKKYGYEVTSGIGITGLTALLDSGKPGRTVALRADMDALPMQEQTDLSYRSQQTGKMHACGHDGHTATLLAVAGALKLAKPDFKGKIKFIFQPAEEGRAGALAMIKDGVLDNPKVDAIFGYHNFPDEPFGALVTRDGCLMAGMDVFNIKIKGKGGHAAAPDKTIDPIYIGSLIVQALQSIASRFTSPILPVVVSVTQFHGGTALNIIPDEVVLNGTIRTTAPDIQAATKQQFQEIVSGIAQSFGAEAAVEFLHNFPPTMNHSAETDLVLNCAKKILGHRKTVRRDTPIMASEDFSYFLERIPGCFL